MRLQAGRLRSCRRGCRLLQRRGECGATLPASESERKARWNLDDRRRKPLLHRLRLLGLLHLLHSCEVKAQPRWSARRRGGRRRVGCATECGVQ